MRCRRHSARSRRPPTSGRRSSPCDSSSEAGDAMKRSVILVVVVLGAAGVLQAQSKALLAPTGTLRSSFIATNPVRGRVDAKTREATGPAADLTRELARRMGVPFVVTPLPDAGAVLESVKRGSVDIGFLAVEAERATQVDFSDA